MKSIVFKVKLLTTKKIGDQHQLPVLLTLVMSFPYFWLFILIVTNHIPLLFFNPVKNTVSRSINIYAIRLK